MKGDLVWKTVWRWYIEQIFMLNNVDMQYMFNKKKSPDSRFQFKSFYVMECGIFIGKKFKIKILS